MSDHGTTDDSALAIAAFAGWLICLLIVLASVLYMRVPATDMRYAANPVCTGDSITTQTCRGRHE